LLSIAMPARRHANGRRTWLAIAASTVALHAGSAFVKPARSSAVPERVILALGLTIGNAGVAGAEDAVPVGVNQGAMQLRVYEESIPNEFSSNVQRIFNQFLKSLSGFAPETFDKIDIPYLSWAPLTAAIFGIVAWKFIDVETKRQNLLRAIGSTKLKFITEAAGTAPKDQYDLGVLYLQLKDQSSALAEFDECEDEFEDNRPVLDPEDTMGALALRAKLHNAKGRGLMDMEPERVAAARREFVRAVTYWPEYPEALINISSELIKRKRWDVAVRTLNTALKWIPGNQDVSNMAGQARMAMNGKLDKKDIDELAKSGGLKGGV